MADGPIAAGGARRSSSATLNRAATVWETDGSNAAPPAPAGAPEARAEDLEAEADPVVALRLPRDDDLLKAPTNDPVRMYLKEIGKVPLLTAAQEVDLAMRIEGGEFATELVTSIDGAPAKVDQRLLRRVVEAVCSIRDHQLDPEKRLRNEGIGRERIARSFRPKTREELVDFARRVERD